MVMWRDFTCKGEVYPVGYPKDSFWRTYHLTKHPIENYSVEGFINILDIDKDSIHELRNFQINQLNCKLNPDFDAQKFCKKCESLARCNSSLNEIFDLFIEHIGISIETDYLNPTMVTFFDERKKRNILLIIDKGGIGIFLRDVKKGEKRKFYLVTAYGFRDYEANEMSQKFRKLFNDMDWRREQMIMRWNENFQLKKNRFKKIKKHDVKNWDL